MEKRLTDNEIIKALKCVPKDASGYIIDENNKMKLVYNEDVIDLINHLQAQNKDLSEIVHKLTIEKDILFDKVEESKTKVEKLNKEIQITKDAYIMLQTKIEIIKSEAIKEFAEKLKNEINIRTTYSREQDKNVMWMIDNLVKEFKRKENTTYDD